MIALHNLSAYMISPVNLPLAFTSSPLYLYDVYFYMKTFPVPVFLAG